METSSTPADDLNPSMKLALAMAIVQSRRRQNLLNSTDRHRDSMPFSYSDAVRWKKKAKQRKQEIIKLKEDLKVAEGLHHGMYPWGVSCKCYFYNDLGHPKRALEPESEGFNDVLRRGFLRHVRLSERRRRRLESPSLPDVSDSHGDNEVEFLRASVDLLVNLCENFSPNKVEDGTFKILSHQATDSILAMLKALSSGNLIDDTIQTIVSTLIMRLMRSMHSGAQGHEFLPSQSNLQFCVQHLMRKLGSDPHVGQHIILSVSQRISSAVESLLSVNPFDGAFLKTHHWLYLMIQLIDFLISDYLLAWPTRPNFDSNLLEEWVASIAVARKSLLLLEDRNSLYMLYMDRIIGELTRNLGQDPFIKILKHDFVKIFS